MVFEQLNALFVFLSALPPVLSTPSECYHWSGPVHLSVSAFVYFLHSGTHFPLLCSLPPPTSSSSFISSPLISSSFFFPSSPALLPLGPVCIPARRGRGVCDPSFDKDQAHSPSVSSPPPWENGCVLLPGRASDSPRGARCQPRQPRLNMICSSAAAAACLHPSLAPALVPPAAEPERR